MHSTHTVNEYSQDSHTSWYQRVDAAYERPEVVGAKAAVSLGSTARETMQGNKKHPKKSSYKKSRLMSGKKASAAIDRIWLKSRFLRAGSGARQSNTVKSTRASHTSSHTHTTMYTSKHTHTHARAQTRTRTSTHTHTHTSMRESTQLRHVTMHSQEQQIGQVREGAALNRRDLVAVEVPVTRA